MVPAMMQPRSERSPFRAANPASGMMSSDGMGGNTFSRNIRSARPG
jgi:hypothetical protein